MTFVKGEGPKKCVLALIGEAPGAEEEIEGRPFVGMAGNILNGKLHRAGLARQECYITNVVKVRPPANDFSIYWKGKHPTPDLIEWRDKLLVELAELDTNVLVPLGANALWAITGLDTIGKWRGSLLSTTINGRQVKVIPTYHPAAVSREWTLGAVMEFDLVKAAREASTSELVLPKRNLIISPTYSDMVAILDKNRTMPTCSFDIETAPGAILCIALAWSSDMAISIPLTSQYWGHNFKTVVNLVDTALTIPGQTHGGQNISYDIQYLMRFFDILPSQPWFDTMLMQHSCYTELPKSLAFLSSIYTNEPYYKDDLKMWKSDMTNMEQLWQYNARDAATTYEVMEALEKEMYELGVESTYKFSLELLEPLLYMMLRGVKFNKESQLAHQKACEERIADLMTRIHDKFGDVNPYSPKQVMELAYKKLKLKPVTKLGKPTVNKDAIDKLAIESPEMKLIAEVRSENTVLSNYAKVSVDAVDGRLRCSFNSTGTETRRLSSDQSVFGSGRNLQNWPERMRDMIIPDEGKEFTNADLRGAESVVVAYLSQDPLVMKLHQEGGNIHRYTASIFFNKTLEEIDTDKKQCEELHQVNKSLYYTAKKLRHSMEKGGSWVTVAEQLRIPAKEAKALVQKFQSFNPNLLRWFAEVDAQLKKNRTIVTPFGDKRIFFSRYGPQMLKDAVAHIAQDTVGKLINTLIVRVYNTLCKQHKDIEVLLQVHDSILFQHLPEHRELLRQELPKLADIKVPYKGGFFTISLDIKSGKNWREIQ